MAASRSSIVQSLMFKVTFRFFFICAAIALHGIHIKVQHWEAFSIRKSCFSHEGFRHVRIEMMAFDFFMRIILHRWNEAIVGWPALTFHVGINDFVAVKGQVERTAYTYITELRAIDRHSDVVHAHTWARFHLVLYVLTVLRFLQGTENVLNIVYRNFKTVRT